MSESTNEIIEMINNKRNPIKVRLCEGHEWEFIYENFICENFDIYDFEKALQKERAKTDDIDVKKILMKRFGCVPLKVRDDIFIDASICKDTGEGDFIVITDIRKNVSKKIENY